MMMAMSLSHQIKQKLSQKPPADFHLHPPGQSSVPWPPTSCKGTLQESKEQGVGSICGVSKRAVSAMLHSRAKARVF